MAKGARNFARKRKLHLKKDNLAEDRIIKSLEKKLKLNKKSSKHLPKSFMDDGLDYLLDICDGETRKIAAESEKQLLMQSDVESNGSDNDVSVKIKTKSRNKKKLLANKGETKRKRSFSQSFSESNCESENENDIGKNSGKKKKKRKKKLIIPKHSQADCDDKSDDDSCNKNIGKNKAVKKKKNGSKHGQADCDKESDIGSCNENIGNNKVMKKKKNGDSKKTLITSKNKKSTMSTKKKNMPVSSSEDEVNFESSEDEMNTNAIHSDQKDDLKKEEDLWEDIYGRKRNKDGSIVSENKQKYVIPALRNNGEKNEKLLFLRRQMKGLLNRLSENTMHIMISQLDELYMSNSRNDMNEMLSSLMLESLVISVLQKERLVMEHMMCIAILHANVDTQVGAHFIMILVKKFNAMIEQSQSVENKELDNLVLMISHLYNFKVFGSQLIYQILDKLINKFTEKEIEIILLILKTAGFRMRKDDPLALKELIMNLQQKAATVKSSNSRIQYMLDVLLAIKNNNMNKIPQYDQTHVDHLKKVLKTLIRKGNTISQLNFSLEDLLNADERGKWWIVGSAWSGKTVPNNKADKDSDNKPVYSQKILSLARAQRMNTDIRKNIFCILMTAEDYLDAFEKLHHLGLKDRQEREIIYVILNCCVQEQIFNPYYAVLLQKFCECDRKYQMTIQYTLWDKLKILNSYNTKQVINMAKLMSHLFIQKALPLSILKVIQLGELDTLTMKLFKRIMLDILLHENTETCLQVFEKIASSEKLNQFREGLRVFINYFLLKNVKKETMSKRQMKLLQNRIELVEKILITSASKMSF